MYQIINILNSDKEFLLYKNIVFNDLIKLNYEKKLFELYIELFGVECGRYFYCDNLNCGKVYSKNNKYNKCVCGNNLKYYYNYNDLLEWYKNSGIYQFNLLVSSDDEIVSFTCGKKITGYISDALLGSCYKIYNISMPNISDVNKTIYKYFDNNDDKLMGYVYFADSGGTSKKYRNSIEPHICSTLPLIENANLYANQRLICINYYNSTMYKINLKLGFDVIAKFENLCYLGIKNLNKLYTAYTFDTSKKFLQYLKSVDYVKE